LTEKYAGIVHVATRDQLIRGLTIIAENPAAEIVRTLLSKMIERSIRWIEPGIEHAVLGHPGQDVVLRLLAIASDEPTTSIALLSQPAHRAIIRVITDHALVDQGVASSSTRMRVTSQLVNMLQIVSNMSLHDNSRGTYKASESEFADPSLRNALNCAEYVCHIIFLFRCIL
jgi:hypothetical protein